MRCTQSDSKSEVHSDTGLPQEMRKGPHKANLSPKTIRKNRIDKAQSQHKDGGQSKEIQPVYSEADQPQYFFGRNDAKAETPVLWPTHAKS